MEKSWKQIYGIKELEALKKIGEILKSLTKQVKKEIPFMTLEIPNQSTHGCDFLTTADQLVENIKFWEILPESLPITGVDNKFQSKLELKSFLQENISRLKVE